MEDMGQTKEHDSIDEVERVVEQHLMKRVTYLMTKKQVGGIMERVITGNVTTLRDLRI